MHKYTVAKLCFGIPIKRVGGRLGGMTHLADSDDSVRSHKSALEDVHSRSVDGRPGRVLPR